MKKSILAILEEEELASLQEAAKMEDGASYVSIIPNASTLSTEVVPLNAGNTSS